MNFFYSYSIEVKKYSSRYNSINDWYSKLCVPDVFKNINIKVFNLMSRTNKTSHASWHKTCKCKCRLDANVCNNNNAGIKINVNVNVKNWLIKEVVIQDLFGILVIVNVNKINNET